MSHSHDDHAKQHKGVLCVPFSNPSRPSGQADLLERLEEWVISAAARANITLVPIRDSFDSASEIAKRLYLSIQDADIIVSVVHGNNPNVFFESGYAVGWDKSILYVALEGEQVPFNIGNVERFVYRQLDDKDGARLTTAMTQCLNSAKVGLARSRDFVSLRQHLQSISIEGGLFGKCMAHTFANLAEWVRSWNSHSNFEFRGAHNILEIGTFILRTIKHGGFVTLYYPGQQSWESDSNKQTPDEYFDATREAVRRHCAITRVYVIDELAQKDEEGFRKMVGADVSAGIDARYILRHNLSDQRASDFGLWDDELFCEVEYTLASGNVPRLHRCRYWSDEYHLTQGRAWQHDITKAAKPCPDLPSESTLLLESEKLPKDAFVQFCQSTDNGKGDCSAYHLSWQTLRRYGMVSTPSWHAAFYTDTFREWSELHSNVSPERPLNILVCGLADYGMLYWVAQSIDKNVRDRSIFHVLDVCQTPLEKCKWLQKRLQNSSPPIDLRLQLHHTSVLDNDFNSASFDLITSDAFLTRFDAVEKKSDVVCEWLRLLRIGGWAVTTARVRESPVDIQASDRIAFVARSAERSRRDKLSAQEVTKAAESYANYIRSFPFDGEEELRTFLTAIGPKLKVHSLKVQSVGDFEMAPATYARIAIERDDEE